MGTKCSNCGRLYTGTCPCVTHKRNVEINKEISRKNQQTLDRMNNKYSGSSSGTYSGPTPTWIKIAIGVIVLGVALFLFSRTVLFNNMLSNVAGIFGGNSVSDNAAIQAVRKTHPLDAQEKGVELNTTALAANKTALDAFMANPTSYRMEGQYQFGYKVSGSNDKTFITDVKMSYNADLGFYQFEVNSYNNQGSQAMQDKKLEGFHIPNGTYYIVTENGKTYVLSDVGGVKSVEEVTNTNRGLHFRLNMYIMDEIVFTDFITDTADGRESLNYRLDDGAYYQRKDNADRSTAIFGNIVDLRTHNNRPVYYYYGGIAADSDVCYNLTLNFYYDKIPTEAPSVSGWR